MWLLMAYDPGSQSISSQAIVIAQVLQMLHLLTWFNFNLSMDK